MTEERCGAINGALVCDREPHHDGNHRGYNAQIDEPMFWPPTGATYSPPWTCVMDFPTAWAFVREQHPDPEEHDPRCSWVQSSGGILCDCHVLNTEYARRKARTVESETRDSIMLAVKADRAAIADFILSCREGGDKEHIVQVFDVLASKIRNGEHLPPLPERSE